MLQILYIENPERRIRDLSRRLGSSEFKVHYAENGRKGLAHMQEKAVDAILCASDLTDMSGFNVLTEIRKSRPAVPFIMLTLEDELAEAVRAIKKGAHDIIRQPLNPDLLKSVIEDAMTAAAFKRSLHSSEGTLNMLLTNLPDIVYSLDEGGRFTNISAASEMVLGYRPEELIGTLMFDLLHEDDRQQVQSNFSMPIPDQDTEAISTLSFRMRTREGDSRFFEVKDRVIVRSGKVLTHDGIARDITERKLLEQKLRRNSRHLEELVEQRTASLESANRQLEALNRAFARFSQLEDENELLAEIPRVLVRDLGLQSAAFILEQQSDFTVAATAGATRRPALKRGTKISGKNALYPELLEARETDKTLFNRHHQNGKAAKAGHAQLVIPVRFGDQLLGLLVGFLPPQAAEIDVQDISRFEMFANTAGLAINNIRSYASMRDQVRSQTQILQEKAEDAEKMTYSLANANVTLLQTQEELERKNAELTSVLDELSRNKNTLESILNSTHNALVMVDNNGIVAATNSSLTTLFGFKPIEILQQEVEKLFEKVRQVFAAPAQFDKLLAELRTHDDTDAFSEDWLTTIAERALPTAETPPRMISLSTAPVLDSAGDHIGRVFTFLDITQMLHSDELVKAIVQISPIPFIVSRFVSGEVLYVNAPLARLAGFDHENPQENLSQELFYDPEDAARLLARLEEKQTLSGIEVRIRSADGTPRWILATAALAEVAGEQVVISAFHDIDERRRAEIALAESEEKFRQLAENINSVFWIRDYASGEMLYISPAFEQIFGDPIHTIMEDPDFFLRYVHPDDRERLHARRESGFVGDLDIEYRILRRSGELRWLRARAFPVRDAGGAIYRYCGVAEDITDHKLAQDKLAERLRYEKGLADCSHALLAANENVKPIEGALLALLQAGEASRIACLRIGEEDAKPAAVSLFHILPHMQEKHEDAFLSTSEKLLKSSLAQLKSGSAICLQCASSGKDDKRHLKSLQAERALMLPMTRDGKLRGVMYMDTGSPEITWEAEEIRLLQTGVEMISSYLERQSALERLSESEARFRSLVENANDLIYSVTPDGKITYVSPNWQDYLGHAPAEMIGQTFRPFIRDEDIDSVVRFFGRIAKTGRKQSGIEFRFQHKDGGWRWYSSNAAALRDANGQLVSFIGIAHDFTEKKKTLEALERTNRELRDTQAQLVQSEKMAALGNLVAGIAHEINTPVGAIHSMHDNMVRAMSKLRDWLEQNAGDAYTENRRLHAILNVIDDANRVIETGSSRVANIVKRLKSFARLDEAELKAVNLNASIDDTLTLVHHEIKSRIEVVREYSDLGKIACFPGPMNQIFLNMLVNATQAIKEEGTITISTWLEADKVHIRFRDDGVGIPKEHLDKIFDPGFTTKGVGVGTGLGLSICYQIIQDHHGGISVESEIGKGTSFTIHFPSKLEEIFET